MTSRDCNEVVPIVRKANFASWPQGPKGQIEQCGISGAQTLAGAIRGIRHLLLKDSLMVLRPFAHAENVIDVELFQAAKSVLEDRRH
jgi:hypothetical protein